MFVPRLRIRTLTCGVALLAGLSACTTPSAPPAPAPAPRADTRADASPLLARVLGHIDEQEGARNTVHGDLGMLGELTGEGMVDYSEPTADLTLHGTIRMSHQADHDVEVMVADGVGYVKSALLRPQSERPWLRVVPGGHDAEAALLGPALERIRVASDPRFAFAGVQHATKIQSAAPEEIAGKPTTRYDLRVPTVQAARTTADPRQRAEMRDAADDGEHELGYSLWVDDNGFPVQFAATRTLERAGEVALTSTYDEWGASGTIQPPAQNGIGTLQQRELPQAKPPR